MENSEDGKVTAADIAELIEVLVPNNPEAEQKSTLRKISYMTKALTELSGVSLTPEIDRKLKEFADLVG